MSGGLAGSSTGWVTQTMTLRYTPDDPTTAPNELRVELEVNGSVVTAVDGTDTAGTTERPFPSLRPGDPIRVGITAGSYTTSNFDFEPPGITYGVPVQLQARVFVIRDPGTPITREENVLELGLDQVCP